MSNEPKTQGTVKSTAKPVVAEPNVNDKPIVVQSGAGRTSRWKVEIADKKEAGSFAAELVRETQRAQNFEDEHGDDVGLELLGLSDAEIIEVAREIEMKARQRPDYYAVKTSDDNLWLVTEFLSSMRLDQFVQLSYGTKNQLISIIASHKDDEAFGRAFVDRAIAEFRDVNGNALRGGRRLQYWRSSQRSGGATMKATVERQKEFLRKKTLPACETKLQEMLNGARMKELMAESEELTVEIDALMAAWKAMTILRVHAR